MDKKKQIKKQNIQRKILLLLIFLSTIFMSIGYATINSISLNINGLAKANKQEGIFITDYKYVSDVNADVENSKILNIHKTLINNKAILSETDPQSSITYKITIYNSSSEIQYYFGEIFDNEFNTNKNITYSISGISPGDSINPNEYKEINLTFKYVKIPTEEDETYIVNYNVLNSHLKFNFDTYDLEVIGNTTYSIYNNNQKVPIIISNNNTYDLKAIVKFNDINISDEITIKAGEKYSIINADLSSIYNLLDESTIYNLKLNITSPVNKIHENVVTFKKEQTMVDIISVNTYINGVATEIDSFSYTENSIAIKNLTNYAEYTYSITVKNNSTTDIYKFRNIDEIINSNNNLNYSSDVNLADGILIKPQREYTFNIKFNYSNTEETNHLQILMFDFKWNYTFGAVSDHLITISAPATNTTSTYGDFKTINANTTLQSEFCTYEGCYSDNNGMLEYDTKSGLILDENNQILTLDIDQSMTVADEYSIYITFKGNTNQIGIPTLDFPGTILAISEASTKYLNWFGFYNNYLHVYSYYNGTAKSKLANEKTENGFVSFNISQYSDKLINMQITAVRGGLTKVYINGQLIKTFNSGTTPVDYKFATIGDLRPGRGLKFTGTIYELGLYNKALSESEVNTNWLYAEETWQIS